MLAFVIYGTLVCSAALCASLACWVPALILGVFAAGIAWRYEIRWLADHTKLTRHEPRPVPPTSKSLKG